MALHSFSLRTKIKWGWPQLSLQRPSCTSGSTTAGKKMVFGPCSSRSPTAVIICLEVPCSASVFLPCPVSKLRICSGVNQGKPDKFSKSPITKKQDFLEWWSCLLPVTSSLNQRNVITNQLFCSYLYTFNVQMQNGFNTLQKAPPSWKKPWSIQTLHNQLWHRTVSFPLYNSSLSAHTEIVS